MNAKPFLFLFAFLFFVSAADTTFVLGENCLTNPDINITIQGRDYIGRPTLVPAPYSPDAIYRVGDYFLINKLNIENHAVGCFLSNYSQITVLLRQKNETHQLAMFQLSLTAQNSYALMLDNVTYSDRGTIGHYNVSGLSEQAEQPAIRWDSIGEFDVIVTFSKRDGNNISEMNVEPARIINSDGLIVDVLRVVTKEDADNYYFTDSTLKQTAETKKLTAQMKSLTWGIIILTALMLIVGICQVCQAHSSSRKADVLLKSSLKQEQLASEQLSAVREEITVNQKQLNLAQRQIDLTSKQIDLAKKQFDASGEGIKIAQDQLDLAQKQAQKKNSHKKTPKTRR